MSSDDDFCPRCGRDMTGADHVGKKAHVLACTDTPKPGWKGQRWTRKEKR